MAKICLDAGHYGKYNRSPAVPAYYESDMNWKLHLLLKKELESYGFEVVTTRKDKNKDLTVVARGKASKGCDLFLSLHSNAVGSKVDESVDRVVVIHLTDDTTTNIDEKSKALANKIAPVIAEVMGTKQKCKVTTKKTPGDRNGDGLLNDNYYGVLHGARQVGTPALILEHSFHTQTRAAKWLLEDANLAKLAKAEAETIASYYGMSKPTAPESSTNETVKETTEKATESVQVGATVKIKAGAVYYNGKAIPNWVMAKQWVVKSVKGDRAVIDKSADGKNAICSPVNTKYLTVTKAVATAKPATKTIDQLAKEVINGKWGNGAERKKRLTAAGYSYAEVQKRVNELCK